jgi:hypothetical protein
MYKSILVLMAALLCAAFLISGCSEQDKGVESTAIRQIAAAEKSLEGRWFGTVRVIENPATDSVRVRAEAYVIVIFEDSTYTWGVLWGQEPNGDIMFGGRGIFGNDDTLAYISMLCTSPVLAAYDWSLIPAGDFIYEFDSDRHVILREVIRNLDTYMVHYRELNLEKLDTD